MSPACIMSAANADACILKRLPLEITSLKAVFNVALTRAKTLVLGEATTLVVFDFSDGGDFSGGGDELRPRLVCCPDDGLRPRVVCCAAGLRP